MINLSGLGGRGFAVEEQLFLSLGRHRRCLRELSLPKSTSGGQNDRERRWCLPSTNIEGGRPDKPAQHVTLQHLRSTHVD